VVAPLVVAGRLARIALPPAPVLPPAPPPAPRRAYVPDAGDTPERRYARRAIDGICDDIRQCGTHRHDTTRDKARQAAGYVAGGWVPEGETRAAVEAAVHDLVARYAGTPDPFTRSEAARALDAGWSDGLQHALAPPPPKATSRPHIRPVPAPVPETPARSAPEESTPMSEDDPTTAPDPALDAPAPMPAAPDAPAEPDPLAGLVERATADVKVLFDPATLAAAAELHEEDPGSFEGLRRDLRLAKVPVDRWIRKVKELARQAVEAARAAAKTAVKAAPGGDEWRTRLATRTTKTGEEFVEPTLANLVTTLVHCPAWAGVLWYDLFRSVVRVTRRPPWHPDDGPGAATDASDEWTDADDGRLACWLARRLDVKVPSKLAAEAVMLAARRAARHPVREYLAGLTWDQTPRLGTWLQTYLGAPARAGEGQPGQAPEYLAGIGTKFLVSLVARVFVPGCQVDHMPVLEGAQGAGKTSAAKALVPHPEWFATLWQSAGDVEAAKAVRGRWLLEMGELDALSRAEVSRVKRFISETADLYRDSYGRRTEKTPRQCAFIGTVNPDGQGYLRDPTGNRRFWPVVCGARIDVDALARDRDQLWAEAVVRYQAGTTWWPGRDEAKLLDELAHEQRERMERDPWEETVAAYLTPLAERWAADARERERQGRFPEDPPGVTTGDLLCHIGKPKPDWTRADQTRVGCILSRLGWVNTRPYSRGNGARPRVYLPPSPTAVQPTASEVGLPEAKETSGSPTSPTSPTTNGHVYVGEDGASVAGGGGKDAFAGATHALSRECAEPENRSDRLDVGLPPRPSNVVQLAATAGGRSKGRVA
jgi:predicted P-loop ATPase